MPLNYRQVENLLYCYKEICAIIENLKIGLRQSDADSLICSMITGNKPPKNTPYASKGNVSDTTGRAASDYLKRNESEKKVIEYELEFYKGLVDRIDAGIDSLSARHQYIIEMKYYDNKTWKEIGQGLKLTERTCQSERKRGVEKLTRLLVITQQVYKRFQEFFEESISEHGGFFEP